MTWPSKDGDTVGSDTVFALRGASLAGQVALTLWICEMQEPVQRILGPAERLAKLGLSPNTIPTVCPTRQTDAEEVDAERQIYKLEVLRDRSSGCLILKHLIFSQYVLGGCTTSFNSAIETFVSLDRLYGWLLHRSVQFCQMRICCMNTRIFFVSYPPAATCQW
jgi:hypothetical protein